MTVFRALGKSFRIKNFKIAAYAWLFNLFFGIIVYWVFYRLFLLSTEDSIMAGDLTYYGFWTSLSEIVRQSGVGFSLIQWLILLLFLMYLLATVFISGGIFCVLINGERTSIQNLFHLSCGAFSKMMRVFFINIINWLLALFLSGVLGFLLLKIQEASGNESLFTVFLYIWLVLTFLILTFSIAIYDFSRIIRLRDERNFIYSFKAGIRNVLANKLNILTIFIFLLVITAILHLLLSVLLNQVEDLLPLLLLWIIYQVFILIKYYFKIIVMNAEAHLLAEPVRQPAEALDSSE